MQPEKTAVRLPTRSSMGTPPVRTDFSYALVYDMDLIEMMLPFSNAS